MSQEIKDDELLPLSGIQHFAFCERQWALIHIEGQWEENLSTAEGRLLHKHVDDLFFHETRPGVRIERSIPLFSKKLKLYGVADLLEIFRDSNDPPTVTYNLVEYKRGKPKPDHRDEVQLCAQAICLEEMRNVRLDQGAIFYGKIKRRHDVTFNDELRCLVKQLVDKMHRLYVLGKTPLPVSGKKCENCSLKQVCVPALSNIGDKAGSYNRSILEELSD